MMQILKIENYCFSIKLVSQSCRRIKIWRQWRDLINPGGWISEFIYFVAVTMNSSRNTSKFLYRQFSVEYGAIFG